MRAWLGEFDPRKSGPKNCASPFFEVAKNQNSVPPQNDSDAHSLASTASRKLSVANGRRIERFGGLSSPTRRELVVVSTVGR